MVSHPTVLEPLVVLVGVAIAVVIFYYLIRWIRHTLGHLGLSPGEIAVIIWATLVGSLINIPLVPFGDGFIGVNVGGAVVPIVLSAYLIRRKGLPINEVLVGIALVAVVSYLVTRYEPGVGVIAEFPWWLLPPFTAFLVAAFAYWHEKPHSAALAYVAGTLGTLIGADIVRLPEIMAGPAPQMVNDQVPILAMGGAGVFDMVFLAGILAVTMEAGLLARTREDLVTQRAHNPIDAEYEAWVREKEKESEHARAKYRQLTASRQDPRTQARREVQQKQRAQATTATRAHAPASSHDPGAPGAGSRQGSRYQPRYRRTAAYRSRYRRSSTRERRFTPTRYRSAQDKKEEGKRQDLKSRAEQGTRARQDAQPGTSSRREPPRGQEDRDREGGSEDSIAGPRPPPRQPRPASGTKRVPASHRARGLYK